MASLREFAKWAGEKDFLPDFKLPTLGRDFPHPLPDAARSLQLLLDCCRTPAQRALVALLGLEGMRLHEALSLGVDHFDLDQMIISVWGKGDKLRVIPITERAWDCLAPQLIAVKLQDAKLLLPYSDRGARNLITRLGCKARISRPISSHDLRATFATLAYEETNDIVLVQGWLGHSEITTTQGYIGVTMEQMRKGGSF